ncbi:MAG TPA: hypothetical protein VLB02_00720 [Candidatus Paceibacterota bacterium]|nr:hypothetical protein [Candidatus Paceibacterota bacterium]
MEIFKQKNLFAYLYSKLTAVPTQRKKEKILLHLLSEYFRLSEICASKAKTDFVTEFTLPIKLRNEVLVESVKLLLLAMSKKDYLNLEGMEKILEDPEHVEITEDGIRYKTDTARLVLDFELIEMNSIMDGHERYVLEQKIMYYDLIQICSSNAITGIELFIGKYCNNYFVESLLEWVIEKMKKRIGENNFSVSY